MTEDDPLNPLTPYCIGKLTGEYLCKFYERQKGLSWIALRFFNVYGPGQKVQAYYTSVINHFVQRIANGEPPVIDGRGDQSMDFVHVHDVARSVVAALDAEQSGMPINIGTGIAHHRGAAGRDPDRGRRRRRRAHLQPPRGAGRAAAPADITRAREVLGWEPKVDGGRGHERPGPGGHRVTPDPATGLPGNPYHPLAWVVGDPEIGEGTWIGAFRVVDGSGGLRIGRGCDVGRGAQIYTHSTARRCVSGRSYDHVDRAAHRAR